MITTVFLDSLGYTTCQCHGRMTCKLCKACEDDLGANAISIFGFDHLRNFVAMREEQARQLTDRKELLEYLQTQPALMQLLEDILMTPKDVDHSPIRRTKMLRIIRAWKERKV